MKLITIRFGDKPTQVAELVTKDRGEHNPVINELFDMILYTGATQRVRCVDVKVEFGAAIFNVEK